MAPTDHTSSFQSIFKEQLSSIPASSRSKSPTRTGINGGPSSRKGKGRESDMKEEEFLKEAYRIHNHLTSLSKLLISVRKAYLSTVEPPPLSRRGNRDHPIENGKEEMEEWKKWEKVKYLTDRERDEIDLRARMILRKCKDRVTILENTETARKSKTPSAMSTTKQTVLSFLPSLLPSELASSSSYFEPIITAHRASVIWTLNDYLAKLTATASNLQEERFKRKEERSKSLGSNATLEATRIERLKNSSNRKIPDGNVVNVDDPVNSSIDSSSHLSGLGGIGILVGENNNIEDKLSKEQIQQFENENNKLLENMSITLSTVLNAEQSLLEISNLQNELIQHLNSQTESIDLLYQDAYNSLNSLNQANNQLKKAKNNQNDSRLFLLIFLIGASLALLFLDWYAA
ncbi:uncharacterized protein L201_006139 [Kwoniella dendrophila CBS 6074]|uniref:SNARE-complex protein Syntaxin-18 N-terminal domain-containing protein n=1 Tax=Kwoniella dendrophila CBS 6074 TaxID=1295534 RepID=A0AAX4K2U3_9TREE